MEPIKPNELRIGSLAYIKGHEVSFHTVEVTSIKLSAVWVVVKSEGEEILSSSMEIDIEYLLSIPLTEDILLRAGFVLNGFKQYQLDIDPFGKNRKDLIFAGDYLYMIDRHESIYDTDCVVLWNKDLKKEFYLHQLQNLYFAVTGEELTLKDK